MRDPIHAIRTWLIRVFLPATCFMKMCAPAADAYPPPAVIPSYPTHSPRVLPAHVQERFLPLDAEAVQLVRPYVIAYEKQQEQLRQRERRTAAALATMGIDYLGVELLERAA